MKNTRRNDNAITLIALVVTIVVLLILAGVSISMLTGENGIIHQATDAKNETEIGTEKEQLNLAVVDAKSPGYVINKNTLTSTTLQEALDKIAGENKTEVTGESLLVVLFKESNRTYYVTTDGKVKDSIEEINIFTYTEDGYITGVKDKYLLDEWEAESNNSKYASIGNIKISDLVFRKLVSELNGILRIPIEIEGTKIIGIDNGAFAGIINLERIVIPSSVTSIGNYALNGCTSLKLIVIQQEQGNLTGEPEYGNDAVVIYVGNNIMDEYLTYEEFTNEFLSNKTQEELEELILKCEGYIGTFEQFLTDNEITRESMERNASEEDMTYVEYLKYGLIEFYSSSWLDVEYAVYCQGGQDKNLEELEELFAKKMGQETFDEVLLEAGITRKEFIELLEQEGYRSEEDYLKANIYYIN